MIVHNIVDISPLYHRFVYRMRNTEKSDIPIMYFVMKEVERMREGVEQRGADVVTSACFDSPGSFRKLLIDDEASEVYKTGRKSILTEQDFADIETMKEIMSSAGINVFCKNGCEADDLMAKLAQYYSDDFELSVLYTTDKDMLANVHGTVGMRKFANGVWRTVSESNFIEEASDMFKTNIPFNAIGLYLCTVGDSADKITGIHKFGKRAFEKLVSEAKDLLEWETLYDYDNVATALITLLERDILSMTQLSEAIRAYGMVRNIQIDDDERESASVEDMGYGFQKIVTGMKLPGTLKVSSTESRIQAYSNAGMKSLAK